jgi:hypothetical protein
MLSEHQNCIGAQDTESTFDQVLVKRYCLQWHFGREFLRCAIAVYFNEASESSEHFRRSIMNDPLQLKQLLR